MNSDLDTDKEDELRPEYFPQDFDKPFVRGKFAGRMRESCNIVVIRPELTHAFPNEEAVNNALQEHLNMARETGDAAKYQPDASNPE